MDAASPPRAWKVLLAFAIIYFVWGSTFLAIRVGVREVPPFLLAGMRFLVAGIVLYGWMRARGTPSPTAREWSAATFLAILIFVFDYGLLFWAERRVPSGIAAVMMATIPVFMAIAEIVFLRTQRLTLRLGLALLVGLAGVAVLVGHTMSLGEAPVDTAGACALIVAGSIVAFTAYVWLIHHESPTKVGTYAYVNPVVAVLVGHFLGGEAIGPRTIVGTLLVLVSVIVITTTPKPKVEVELLATEAD